MGGGGRCSCWDVRDFCVPEAISASPLRQCWFGVEATRHSAIFAGNASRDLSGLVPKKARLSNCLVTSIGVACGCWQVRQTDEKWPISSNHPRISVKNCKKKGGGSMLNQNQHMSGCSRQFPGVCRSRRNAGESGAKRDGRGRQDRQDKRDK